MQLAAMKPNFQQLATQACSGSIGASSSADNTRNDTLCACNICDDTGVVIKGGVVYPCACQRAKNNELRRKYSGLPKYTERPMLAVTREYIAHYSELRNSASNWLVYMGRSGCGKSTQAYMVVDALLNRQKAIYARVHYYPELVRELSALRFDYARYESKLDEIMEPELLLFDDYLDVAPKPESFEEHVALSLIKRRYQLQKPLIITTELTPTTFQKVMPRHCEAILGRIFEMTNGRLEIASANAPNYRFVDRKGAQ